MRVIQLKSTNGSLLFEGSFSSIIECLEYAVAEKKSLPGIDLRNLNLSNASLDDACMPGAAFTGSNMTGVNLSDAKLEGSDFSGTALYNACLCESDLSRCNFEDASFGATDLTGSMLVESIFSTTSSFSLDFSGVRDMRGCVFKNPCGLTSAMSRPPIVIQGLLASPIVFFDRHVKIGTALKSHEEWFSLIDARYLKDRNLKLAG